MNRLEVGCVFSRREGGLALAALVKGDGEFGGGDHAVGRGYVFAGHVKGGAVVGAGADEREPEGDVHASVEGVELERDEALVVIHANDAVPFMHDGGLMKNSVGRERAGKRRAGDAFQRSDGGCDDVDFFTAKVTVLAAMGVESSDSDTGLADAAMPQMVG